MSSKRVSVVLKRAIGRLPRFHLVMTDNAMSFTMRIRLTQNEKRRLSAWLSVSACATVGLPSVHRGKTASSSGRTEPTMTNAFRSSNSAPLRNAVISIGYGRCTTTPSVPIKEGVRGVNTKYRAPVKTKTSARDPSLFRTQAHSACGLDSAR